MPYHLFWRSLIIPSMQCALLGAVATIPVLPMALRSRRAIVGLCWVVGCALLVLVTTVAISAVRRYAAGALSPGGLRMLLCSYGPGWAGLFVSLALGLFLARLLDYRLLWGRNATRTA
jgi:hypothetical protein